MAKTATVTKDKDTTKDAPTTLAAVTNPRTATVTGENPTPPTNMTSAQGTPPTDPTWVYTDDGATAGTINGGANGNVFFINTLGPYLPEGSGTEVNVPFPGQGGSPQAPGAGGSANSDLGSYTETPNGSHPSSSGAASNPTLTSISPASSVHGSAPVTMTVTGTNFTANSVIYINGVAQTTTFGSSTSLTCTATPSANTGSYFVGVQTPNYASPSAKIWTFT